MTNTESRRRYTIASVAKALSLVDVIAESSDGLTISELTRRTGTSKSTIYGLVRTLSDAGFLRVMEPGPRYALGMALIRLGDVASNQVPVREILSPVARALSHETNMTVRIAIVDSGYPVFVDRIDAAGAVRFHAPLGVRELPHTSAAGKSILATLPDDDVAAIASESGLPARTRKTITDLDALMQDLSVARRRGYSIDDEEDFDGIFCVAAPFFNHSGNCVGTMSATGIKIDGPRWQTEDLGRAVRRKADEATALLGGRISTREA